MPDIRTFVGYQLQRSTEIRLSQESGAEHTPALEVSCAEQSSGGPSDVELASGALKVQALVRGRSGRWPLHDIVPF